MTESKKEFWLESLNISDEIKESFKAIEEYRNIKNKNNLINSKDREEFIRKLSLQGYLLLSNEYQNILSKICEEFLKQMKKSIHFSGRKIRDFTEDEIKTARTLLEWAKYQSVVLPSITPTPSLNIYHNGKRVIAFLANIKNRWDVEILFRNERLKNENLRYLLNRKEDRMAIISRLRIIGITKELDPNGRKTLRYDDISRPIKFCEVLSWIVEEIGNEPHIIQQLKNEIIEIRENTILDTKVFNFNSFEDARRRIEKSIALREGQGDFRKELINYYGRCIVTGCSAIEVLEAAHIYPYRGKETNVIQNGLLLRADIHTLFDRYLITINPDSNTTHIAPHLLDTEYRVLKNKTLDSTITLQANKSLLKQHYHLAISIWKR